MIVQTILFVICSTLVLSLIKNKSNFSNYLMIPVIVSLFTKYSLGDWDVGYQWTKSDIVYWTSLFGFSVLTLWIKEKLM
jgi:hypothetical protein